MKNPKIKIPPFHPNNSILNHIANIVEIIGQFTGLNSPPPPPLLRKQNMIKTIQGSLQIEGNTLTLEQITAILDQKKVIGPAKEIKEVQNANHAYSLLLDFKPFQLSSFCKAHKALMDGLMTDAGKLRSGNVGIFKGSKISFVAPKAAMVPELMENLFLYLKNYPDHHPLIKSSIFHYEVEFIHPFSDGNGRIGRLWQTRLLSLYNPLFSYLPLESTIKDFQLEYYQALEQSDQMGESTPFVEFMLKIILKTVSYFMANTLSTHLGSGDRILKAKEYFLDRQFSRKDYMLLLKNISAPTASRDLKEAVVRGLLRKKGEKRLSVYYFLKKPLKKAP